MTSFHHQPEAQHPIFSCQQERRPITPSFGRVVDMRERRGISPAVCPRIARETGAVWNGERPALSGGAPAISPFANWRTGFERLGHSVKIGADAVLVRWAKQTFGKINQAQKCQTNHHAVRKYWHYRFHSGRAATRRGATFRSHNTSVYVNNLERGYSERGAAAAIGCVNGLLTTRAHHCRNTTAMGR